MAVGTYQAGVSRRRNDSALALLPGFKPAICIVQLICIVTNCSGCSSGRDARTLSPRHLPAAGQAYRIPLNTSAFTAVVRTKNCKVMSSGSVTSHDKTSLLSAFSCCSRQTDTPARPSGANITFFQLPPNGRVHHRHSLGGDG